MSVVISTHPFIRNAPLLYSSDNAGGAPIVVSYSTLIPNLNVTPTSILTAQNGALVNNGEITVSFASDQPNIVVVASIHMNGQPARGLFRVRARKSTGPGELTFFLLNDQVSTAMLFWEGGFDTFGLQNLSQVTVAAYLAAGPGALIASPL